MQLMRMERKNNEGIVIETPAGAITICVQKKIVNGRILLALEVPDDCNVYRIDEFGVSQNKKGKATNDKFKKKSYTQP